MKFEGGRSPPSGVGQLMVSPTSNKPISDPGAIEVDDATDSEETVDLVYHPSPTKGCDNI
ncbi:hypothetical protein BDV33DRAFT_184391, partial [Aspergillus novoparasiticus]